MYKRTRPYLLIICLIITLGIVVYSYTTFLRESWTELNMKMGSLIRQNSFKDGMIIGEKALKVAKNPFIMMPDKLPRTLTNFASMYERMGKYDLAEKFCKETILAAEKRLQPDHPIRAINYKVYADICKKRGQYKKAEDFDKKGLNIWIKSYNEPEMYYKNLGDVTKSQGKYRESIDYYKKALPAYERKFGANCYQAGGVYNNLGEVYLNLDMAPESKAAFAKAREIKELRGKIKLHEDLYNEEIGEKLIDENKHDEAVKFFLDLTGKRREKLGQNHPSVGTSLLYMAQALNGQGEYEKAEAVCNHALYIYGKSLDSEHHLCGIAYELLANSYKYRGKYDEAENYAKKALEIKEKNFGIDSLKISSALHVLAQINKNQGKFSEAEVLFKRSKKIKETTLVPLSSDVANDLNELGYLYKIQGKFDDALRSFEEAKEINVNVFGSESKEVASSWYNIANILKDQLKLEEAEKAYQ